jgi:hypothetical protein
MIFGIAITSGISLLLVVLVLIWPRICKEKAEDTARKERAANGMVIPPLGANDFDEIPNSDIKKEVEMADL